MSKVYIVTAGSYSDYHILGVFLDKDKAEQYVKIHNHKPYWSSGLSIETYDTMDKTLECHLEKDIYMAKCNISDANKNDEVFFKCVVIVFKKMKTFNEAGCYDDVTRYYSKDCRDEAGDHHPGEIYIVRSYEKGKYTEKYIKSVMTKVINDLIVLVSDLKYNFGADDDQIKELIENAM